MSKGIVTCLAWHGRHIAVGSASGQTHIFDIDAASLIMSGAHFTTVRCVDVTDTHVVSGASDGCRGLQDRPDFASYAGDVPYFSSGVWCHFA